MEDPKPQIPDPRSAAFLKSLARFQDRLTRAAMHPEEPANIHSLRISVRRLRVALASSATPARESWMQELKPIFRATGKLRDLQVQRDIIGRLHPSSLEGFQIYARGKEAETLQDAKRILNAFQNPTSQTAEVPAGKNEIKADAAFLKRLNRRFDHLNRELKAFSSSWTPERIHALRISLKRIRYALEQNVPRPRKKDGRELLIIWQDRLGEVQDLIVLRQTAIAGGFSSPGLNRAIELRKSIMLRSIEGEPASILRKKLTLMRKALLSTRSH